MATSIIQTPQGLLFAALAILTAALLYAQVKSYARLRHIPGPLLASLTDLWSATKVWRGAHHCEIVHELHQKYGPIVRFGPNRVSFANPDTIPQIYGTGQVFPKASSYNPMRTLANGKEIMSLVTISDEKKVTSLKRHISAGFSQSTWLKQEAQIDGTLKILITQLRARAGQEVPLNTWLSFWSFDTLTELAFSESRGFLTAGRDLDGICPSGHQRFAHWRLWASLPGWEAVIYKNWIVTRIQRATGPLAQLAIRRIQQRKAEDKAGGGGKDLLGRYLAASQEAPEAVAPADVLGLTISTIHAGSETTAMTSSATLVYLLWNPATLARLEEEVLGAGLSFPPRFAEVDKLVYLDAVIREGMRLFVNPNCVERTITPPGAEIGGVYLPAGTGVSISELDTTRDPAVYGADPHSFKPERWLNVDKTKWAEMNRVSFGFSYGRRECIGKHLARMEMKKLLASLILSFKIVPTKPVQMWMESSLGQTRLDVRLEPRVPL